jgi:hypothetical protein
VDYEIRIDMKLKRPVIAYIKDGTRTVNEIRGTDIEQVEQEADEWIKERTPKGIT